MADFRVVICGNGPIAEATARLLVRMDFEVVHVAPMASRAARKKWAGVDRRIVCGYDAFANRVWLRQTDFLVIATRVLASDLACLRRALNSEAGFIALVSGSSRWKGIKQTLAKEGLKSNLLKRIASPAGIEIGSTTPDEIGLSIVAQLVQQRAARLFGKQAAARSAPRRRTARTRK